MGHIYGENPIKVESDVVDRIGIRRLVLSRLWMPQGNWRSQADLDEQAPDIPAVSAGVILIGEQTRQTEGGMRTTWTFEGIKGNGKTVTFKGRNNSLDYNFEPGISQATIKNHPRWSDIKRMHNGYVGSDGEVIWPPVLGVGSGGGYGLGSGDGTRGLPNPMYDHKEFYRFEGTYRFRYASLSEPRAFSDVARSVDTSALPGKPPFYPGRDWLMFPPSYSRRGFIFEIIELYWLSGEGGWPKPIYRIND